MKRYFVPFILAVLALFSVSCEFENTIPGDTSNATPEFLLEGARITRYENGTLTAELQAGMVEQYKNINSFYGSDISFVIYEKDGTEIGRGQCGLFSADNDTEQYYLFDSIVFENSRDQFELQADALKWSAKHRLLGSEKKGTITIIKSRGDGEDGNASRFSLTGAEFSADGNKQTFEFNAPVSGIFETEDYADEE
jgi:LPS export ABC transporter protein LptC